MARIEGEMKLIIAGGREYQFNDHDYAKLNAIHEEYKVTEVVSGGATGADKCGEVWADANGIAIKRYPADWLNHGRAAGPIRNRVMAEYADAVALFQGGRGTDSMCREAEKVGIVIFDCRKVK